MNDSDRMALLGAIGIKVDELRDAQGGLLAVRRLAIARTKAGDTVKAIATDGAGGGGGGSHSDPTVATLIAHDPSETVTQLAAWDRLLDRALDALCSITNGTGGVLRELSQQYEPPVEQPVGKWCESCKRLGYEVHVDTGRYKDYCRNCGEWKAAHDGKVPPRLVIKAWYEGRRVTTQLIDRAHRAEGRR